MNVSLSPEMQRFIDENVRSGRYASSDDVVRSALSLLQTQDDLTTEDIEELREALAPAIAQADRGEFVDFSATSIIAEGNKLLADRQKAG
jgi:antitoxin ParD1/3/4